MVQNAGCGRKMGVKIKEVRLKKAANCMQNAFFFARMGRKKDAFCKLFYKDLPVGGINLGHT